ncbi:extracellular calcium-sensing receptor-like [Erpetoichthys calabaricus]|uniref:extracellular calcium-sensing receptor-like n=1 Tax=Erpetoichthys calabaricus TaxID=27687 RepID=UPI0022349BB7|nr:extracellular calcium-sensing receptor-like [Erpetoichthys calabaricus]
MSIVKPAEEQVCRRAGRQIRPSFSKDGDLIIGAIFSIHDSIVEFRQNFTSNPESVSCKSLNFRELQFAQTVRFAVDEINNNTDILGEFVVGYKIYDSCGSIPLALMSAMDFANGQDKSFTSKTACSSSKFIPTIIGESSSSSTIALGSTFAPFRIPLVSHCATCACLDNKREYPSFFRTPPSDSYQSAALVHLLKHYGWNWIGVVRSDNHYGISGMTTFMEKAQKEGICIEYSERFYRTDSNEVREKIVNTIKTSTAKAVVAFMVTADILVLLQEILNQNVTGIQWIGTEAWSTDPVLVAKTEFTFLLGTIGLGVQQTSIPGFKDFLYNINQEDLVASPTMKEFWEEAFQCTFSNISSSNKTICSGFEDLRERGHVYNEVTKIRVVYNAYKAVYIAAHSMNNLFSCSKSKNRNSTSCGKDLNVEPWQVRDIILYSQTFNNNDIICKYDQCFNIDFLIGVAKKVLEQLKSVNVTLTNGQRLIYNENGSLEIGYDLVNWQINKNGKTEVLTVGYYNPFAPSGRFFTFNNRTITWSNGQEQVPNFVCSESCTPGSRKSIKKGKSVCCFDCIPCARGKITNTTNALDCIECPWQYWSNNQGNQCILKKTEFLSFNEFLGIILTTFAVIGTCLTLAVTVIFFLHRNTPIVKANNSELSFLLLLALTLCFLCSVIFIGQPTVLSCMMRHTAFAITFSLCMSCILAKTIVVLMAFRATRPGHKFKKLFGPLKQKLGVAFCTFIQCVICALWLTMAPPLPYQNIKHYKDVIILECDLGSSLAFYATLGYIGLLSLLCLVLAFLARQLPDNFNEAKYITFSMIIFCTVWFTFIPAYISSPGKYIVAVEIFAILASSFGLLFCIFAPRCYVILIEPEKNTRKHMMGKTLSKTK